MVDVEVGGSLNRLPTQTMSDLAYSALRAALLRRQLAPGRQLDLADIGHRLGISTTPLKQALRRLEAEGLIEIRPRLGTFVRSVTEERLREVAQARLAIESWGFAEVSLAQLDNAAVELDVNLRMSDQLVDDMDEDSVDLEDRFAILDHDFHRAILRAAGNEQLDVFFEMLGSHVLLARAWCLEEGNELRDRVRVGLADHRGMLDSLRAGDRQAARHLLQLHVMRGTEGACQIVRANGGAI